MEEQERFSENNIFEYAKQIGAFAFVSWIHYGVAQWKGFLRNEDE